MIPTFADVRQASQRLAGIIHRTPIVTSSRLNAQCGAQIYLKCENLQRMGAFKFRGAYNALAALPEEARRHGVLTYSSGNHAQAVALSARLLGMRAVILMPSDGNPMKIGATCGYGAEVRLYDRKRDDREEIAQQIINAEGATLVHPFDDADVIAGQGTAAMELMEKVPELEVVLAPLGGGGLLAGTALAVRAMAPACLVIGVEPEASDDGKRSFQSGRRVSIPPPDSIAEGALGTQLGARNFDIILRNVADIVTVRDEAIIKAMQALAQMTKLVVEPTGALALAALLDAQIDVKGKKVGVVLSGGNVDLARYGRLLTEDGKSTQENA